MLEAATSDAVINSFLAYGLPFLCFLFGVQLAVELKLIETYSRRQVWLISIPVGLVVMGVLFASHSVTIEGVDMVYQEVGYMSSVPQYLLFTGLSIFYGTAAPTLFGDIRRKLISDATRPKG
jgi:hypothetical protein